MDECRDLLRRQGARADADRCLAFRTAVRSQRWDICVVMIEERASRPALLECVRSWQASGNPDDAAPERCARLAAMERAMVSFDTLFARLPRLAALRAPDEATPAPGEMMPPPRADFPRPGDPYRRGTGGTPGPGRTK